MELIADILLIAGATGAAFYCIVLSRRLSRFNDLEKGVGGAIAVLSAQVDDMTRTLESAQGTATGSTQTLEDLTTRAQDVADRLELLVASMHDLPTGAVAAETPKATESPAQPTSQDSPAQTPVVAPVADAPSAQASSGEAEKPTSLFRSGRSRPGEAAA